MDRIFFGKISKLYPQQYEKNFYAAGQEGSSWYGGLKIGDYVYPIYNSSVSKLWKVKGFSEEPNEINTDGSIQFEVVRKFNDIPISSVFARNRHFILDINLVNRLTKSTANVGQGFFQINTEPGIPSPDQIDLNDTRNIYITIEKPFNELKYKDGDIRIRLNSPRECKIESIDVFNGGKFTEYDPLFLLYKEKNENAERYNLNQLLDYAIQDGAEKKKEYLKSVIEEVKKKGFFIVGSPIGLYDNILVGRKKTKKRKEANASRDDSDAADDIESVEEATEEFKEFVDLLDSNPNLILYGPPGTGKTYSASKIVEAFDSYRLKTHKSFKQIESEGRVDFVTFHQSFSYEEFVEGLRPVIKADSKSESEEGESNLQYKIQDGILKQIANKADLSQIKSELKGEGVDLINEDNTVWKISLGRKGADENIYKECIKSNTIAIGFLNEDLTGWGTDEIYDALKREKAWKSDNPKNDVRSIDYFINQMQEGDVVLVFASVTSIRTIGVITGEYEYNSNLDSYRHKRSVKWLKEFKEPINILKYNNGVRLTLPTVYPLNRFKFSDIKEILDVGKDGTKKKQLGEVPYYLIIDEINRGNISKIFGELITLIEKDKRNVYSCKLPYSQKPFSLPSNLYIIGTMNTADRSIAVLDVALRRRFYFKEIEPDKKIIERENSDILQHLDLIALFDRLNAKISNKLDRDHRIGHSHFLNAHTLAGLRMVWYYQIIPLLMEYFYNDATSIAEIIGESFVNKDSGQIKWIADDKEFRDELVAIK